MQIKLTPENEADLRTITKVTRRTITTEANLLMELYISLHRRKGEAGPVSSRSKARRVTVRKP